MRFAPSILLMATLWLNACSSTQGTEPPPEGWANNAPTLVTQVVDREDTQLLEVEQASLKAWIEVPKVGAKVGDYVLLGQGTARSDVQIPELDRQVGMVVDIAHIQVVDEQTARRTVVGSPPPDAVAIGTLYAELAERADSPVVVYGTAVKVTSAAGSVWIHLQDGTGDASTGSNDLAIQAEQPVTVGQRVAFRGVLRADVDIGFGYHFDVLLREAVLVE